MTYSRQSQDDLSQRLLVVDDRPDNLFLIQSILEGAGYQVELASSGAEALHQIESTPPALVLLDVMMPDVDGYEVTRRLRHVSDMPFIPILLMTAYDQPSVVKGLDLGADDFVRKPIEVEELLARVRSLLRLKQSIDERDFIARQRQDFVSRLTHDLRTPLIAADRTLEMILQENLGPVSDEIKQVLPQLARSNHHLLELVNKLLQVYRFEAGVQKLHFGQVDLAALLSEVVSELAPLAQDKQIPIYQEVDPELPSIEGDRLELRRVLINLLDNAIKFTKTGQISLSLRPAIAACTAPEFVLIKVTDTGIGMPAAQQQVLFEPFSASQCQNGGSGLGLYLSRYIVEAHQGSVTVLSQPATGSCFTICLPVKQPEQPT